MDKNKYEKLSIRDQIILNEFLDVIGEVSDSEKYYQSLLQEIKSIADSQIDRDLACNIISREISFLGNLEDHKNTQPAKKTFKWNKIVIGAIACIAILFTMLFGGIVISSDFRHMVFSTLEGDGKIIISSEMVDSQVSEEEIANIMHPTALDGQGYTIRADGQFTENYTLTYSKPDSTITFDVRRGEAQIFLDTDWTGWQKINFNGAVIYISNKPDGCTLEMLMQNEVKCSITSQLSPEETLALAKSVGVQSDTKK